MLAEKNEKTFSHFHLHFLCIFGLILKLAN